MRLEASLLGCRWHKLGGPHRGLGDVLVARERLEALREIS